MQETITYIIQFLLHSNDDLISHVGYTSDESKFKNYRVVIIPSRFFDDDFYGTAQSEPKLPLQTVEATPLLYGNPTIRKEGNTLLIDADIIASSYFLLSRYEETLHRTDNRDEHGRFQGTKSLPYRANFINRPIVDEYGKLLRSWLRKTGGTVTEPEEKINRVYLTHDVDTLAYFRHFRGFLGGIARSFLPVHFSLKKAVNALFSLEKDPAYTFPWIYKTDNTIQAATPIYFIKAANPVKGFDYPSYNHNGKDFRKFVSQTLQNSPNAQFGLHASYQSGFTPEIIASEQKRLQKALPQQIISSNRHHYLRALQPEDMMQLIEAGITDDYTLGYADVAGFRLGTCRAVRFINPNTKELTKLTLHPLTIMDCTLSEEKYMNLDYESALQTARNLIDETKKHQGDLCLLWHNTTFITDNYHKKLYTEIINKLNFIGRNH